MTAINMNAAQAGPANGQTQDGYGQRITSQDFARMFRIPAGEMPADFAARLSDVDTAWREPTRGEIDAYTLNILQKVTVELRQRKPEENQAAFEGGWRENLKEVQATTDLVAALRPRYFRSSPYLRYNKTIVVGRNGFLEPELFQLARRLIFEKYLGAWPSIYEFGCGSCSNLFALSEYFPDKALFGFDWCEASVQIAEVLRARTGKAINGQLFDMLHPPAGVTIQPGGAVLTIHALEQLGQNHTAFLQWLLRARPSLVVNYEPIQEFYDPANLYDLLALVYSQRRGYLNGYYTALKQLEEAGQIKIIEAYRPMLGGVIHEASLLVWRPI